MLTLERVLQYGSFSTVPYGYIFCGICLGIRAKTTVEIGFGRGYISAWLVYTMQKTGGIHHSVDIEENKNVILRFEKEMERLEVDKHSRIYLCGSSNLEWEEAIDFIFIDGAHDYKQVSADINKFSQYVIPKGYMAIHDYLIYDDVKQACEDNIDKNNWRTVVIDGYKGDRNKPNNNSGVLLCQRE